MGITATSTEAEVLGKIKDLALKTPNWLLNLCEFFKMTQREGEGVRQYVARLKGAADLCDFMVHSGEDRVSYVDQMVLGRLVAGLRDKQIVKEILEEAAIKGLPTSRMVLRHILVRFILYLSDFNHLHKHTCYDWPILLMRFISFLTFKMDRKTSMKHLLTKKKVPTGCSAKVNPP